MFYYYISKIKIPVFYILSTAFGFVTWLDAYCMLTHSTVFGINRASFGYVIADFITYLLLVYLRDKAGADMYDIIEESKWKGEE